MVYKSCSFACQFSGQGHTVVEESDSLTHCDWEGRIPWKTGCVHRRLSQRADGVYAGCCGEASRKQVILRVGILIHIIWKAERKEPGWSCDWQANVYTLARLGVTGFVVWIHLNLIRCAEEWFCFCLDLSVTGWSVWSFVKRCTWWPMSECVVRGCFSLLLAV